MEEEKKKGCCRNSLECPNQTVQTVYEKQPTFMGILGKWVILSLNFVGSFRLMMMMMICEHNWPKATR